MTLSDSGKDLPKQQTLKEAKLIGQGVNGSGLQQHNAE